MFTTATTAAEDVDARLLISRLARPAPAIVDFTEVRFSPLLKQPLIVSGTLRNGGPHELDRQVMNPYREATEIRGNAVRVRREGEPERSFALRRAPELQGLLNAFTSVLAGDSAEVERSFNVAVAGTAEKWELTLSPRDARLSRQVRQIRIEGHNDLPQCLWVLNDKSGASVMLLGTLARAELPQPLTREWLERKCGS